MKFLIAFFWSSYVFSGQCAPLQNCDKSQIPLNAKCPRYVCDGGLTYHCKQTINRDRTRTCAKGALAKKASCSCG